MNKLISVIIPVKNGSNYLGEALGSIRRQGMETEVIVVDDGSEDNTAEIASSFGAKVISHPVSKGQVAAKNTGIRAATGEYVVFMDHDDLMREGSLQTLYNAIEADPGVSAVQAKVKDFFSPEVGPIPGIRIQTEPYYGLFTGAIMIRRRVFDTIGPLSEDLHSGEIIEWSTRMEAAGFVTKKVDFVATDRRVHNTNYGRTSKDVEFKDYVRVLRERLKMKKQ